MWPFSVEWEALRKGGIWTVSEQTQVCIGEQLEVQIQLGDLVFHEDDGVICNKASNEDGVRLGVRCG